MATDAENLRTRMALIRQEIDDDVEAVVEQAKELFDWRNFVKKHPLLSISAAAAAGFLLVPKRSKGMTLSSCELEKLAKHNPLAFQPNSDVRHQPSMVRPVVSLVTGAVMRNALALAGQHAARLLAPSGQDSRKHDTSTTAVTGEGK